MAVVNPQTIFNYLVGTHGVSVPSAAGILANIQFESGFNTAIVGDGGTSGGLFQHHAGRWAALKNYANSVGRSWTDWQVQVDFAMKEARQMGLNLQHTSAYDAAYQWCVKFERPANATAKGKERANAAGRYLYGYEDDGTASVGSQTTSTQTSGNAAPNPQQGELNLPTGGSFIRVDGQLYVAYRFHGVEGGPTAVVYYRVDQSMIPSGAKVGTVSGQTLSEWRASGQWVDGGDAQALRGIPKGTSYQSLVDDTLMELGLAGTSAVNDSGVMNIVALAMTREMSEAELANRLRRTEAYQTKTDKQREWDDLSDAEKEQRVIDEAMGLAQLYFTYVGEDLAVDQWDRDGDGRVSADEIKKGNSNLYQWALDVASGKSTQTAAVNTWLKSEAKDNPNSPWSRTLREEEQAQGQFQVDIENTAEQLRDLYYEWGLPIRDDEAMRMAEDIIMNKGSLADVEQGVRDQAQALYPNKPTNIPTRTWAAPYMQQYMMTLEVPEVDLMSDALLQVGLRDGMTLADFTKMLRADDRWLKTDNARIEMNDKISQLGRQFGF